MIPLPSQPCCSRLMEIQGLCPQAQVPCWVWQRAEGAAERALGDESGEMGTRVHKACTPDSGLKGPAWRALVVLDMT